MAKDNKRKPGRRSGAELSVVQVSAELPPTVPDDLLPDERELWTAIVNSRPTGFFCVATLPLLSEYCRLQTQVLLTSEKIEEFSDNPEWLNVDDGAKRYKLLTGIRDQGQGRMIALARTMRLTQQARYVPDKAGARPTRGAGTRKPWE